MINKRMFGRYSVFLDLIYTVTASLLDNFTLQFLLYPAIERQVGEARYGKILVFLTLGNVCGLAFGGAANSISLTSRQRYQTTSGDFFCILAVISLFAAIVSVFVCQNYAVGWAELVCVAIIVVLFIFRSYSFVEFQLRNDYFHYLVYNIIICVGELIFLPFYSRTQWWPILFLPGTILGLVYVIWRGTIYRKVMSRSNCFRQAAKETLSLSGANLLNYGAQNADRFLLLPLAGGVAVAQYYVASLLSKTLSMITGPLNNLIIGYLSNRKKPLTRRIFGGISLAILFVLAFFFVFVWVVSPFVLRLPFLYPEMVDAILWLIPLASIAQLLVIGSSILIVLDLLVAPSSMQVLLQAVYTVFYIVLAIPFTLVMQLKGFVIASCIAAFIRYLTAVIIGWYYLGKQEGVQT